MSITKYRHEPEFRCRMRELIQGFVEHCELSPSLIGRIEGFVHFEGRKYGIPVFTLFGPIHPEVETEFVGMVGINTGQDALAAETLLQLIERLALQPRIAEAHVLRIVPVSDPVRLEHPVHFDAATSMPMPEDGTGSNGIWGGPLDGLVELLLTDKPTLGVSAIGPVELLRAVLAGEEALRRLGSEAAGDPIVAPSRLVQPANASSRWRLTLEIPRCWSASVAVHWASQFLVVFLRTRTALLAAARSRRIAHTNPEARAPYREQAEAWMKTPASAQLTLP